MKKTTRLFGILLIAAMLLGLLAMTASAATVERMDGFTVKVTDLVYTTDGSSISSANFYSISYKAVNSTTIQFTYSVWLYEGAGSGGSSRADQTATLNNYSCTEDIDVKIPMTYSNGSGRRNWTYNLSVTKAAGHVYDNACDTECNICKETRTITHDYQGGNCTTDAVCTVCGDVKTAPGHIYAAGACTTCGEACPHTGNSPVIIDNRNGTHTQKYNCCGLVVSTTDHQLDAEGFCTTAGCGGYQAAVLNGGTYEISNAGQLYWFAQHVNSGNQSANGRLTANITVNTNVLTATGDLNGDPASFRAWTPIDEYRGSFHGDGYVISGLYAKAYGVGFISYGINVKVYNLGVMDSYFENTGYASGAIVGYMSSNGTVENCFSNATIAGSSYISGGLVGQANHYATVKNCYYFGKTVGGAFANSSFSWYDSKSGNNYYVSTVDDGCKFTTAISPDILATGELAYLLNGSVNGGAAWGQVIGTDAYPIPVAGENEKVYRTTLCNGDQGYANAEKITEHDPSVTAADRFNKAGRCLVCGTQAAATVNGEYIIDIDTAFAQANATNGATLKLLTNVTLSKVEMKGTFTLDLNGFTLNSADNYQYSLYVTAGHLTIQDSVGTGAILTNARDSFIGVYNSASFTVTGGTFGEVIANVSGAVTVTGGKFAVLNISGNGTKSISGGEFGTLWCTSTPLENCLVEDYYIYNASGELVDTREIRRIENVTVRKGADLKYAEIILEYTENPYTALAKMPTVTVTINGRTVAASHYDVSYADNTNIGTATVTVTGKGIYSGENTAAFTITKGSLKVVTNPETTYEFGDVATDKAVTGGKVVIVGNESAVIPGTWAWIVPGETAQFTPDAQYIDLFEALTEAVTVTHVVTPASPVIEVVTPSPSIMPGMAIRMSVVVKNPHNGELTDLPTAFRVTYKIGENGTPVTVSGLEFTLPTSGVALGDKVYVTVENVAVSGKYAVAVSTNTIELAVGQVDYTAAINALEEQIAALKAEYGADVSELEAALEALRQQLAALNDTYATDEELAAAVQTINNTISELTNRITTLENTYATKAELEQAKAALEAAIATNSGDIAALEAAVAALEKALTDAIVALEQADETNRNVLAQMIAEARATLQTAIDALEDRMTAAEENITLLRSALEQAIADLEAAIATNSGDIDALEAAVAALEQALADAINELKGLISAAEAAAKAYTDEQDAALRTALETMINEAKATLEAAIAALDARVTQNEADIAALQAALTKAIEDLNKAIAEGDAANAKALEEAVAELTRLLNEAVAKLEQADAENKAALEELINQAKTALEAAIAQLRADLEQSVEELEEADKANAEALAQAIIDLTAIIEAVEEAAAAEDAAIRAELAAAKAALEMSISRLRNELYVVRGELLTIMDEKDAVLDGKIAELAAALEAAIAASQAADEALKAELTAAIEAAEATLTAAIEKVAEELASVHQALTISIAAGDKALHSRVDDLTAALEAAIAASVAADGALRTELNSRIDEAVATLNAAIDQVQKNLDEAVAALNAKDAEQDQTITIALVIASLGVAGCLALAIVIIVDKRKRA